MKNAEKSAQVIAFPKKVENQGYKGGGSPAMRKKAYEAFHNARQRCNNPKNPGYPQYGGANVQFLFTNFQELLDEVGLPKANQSLDRIDPNGNYEPGNVRWTNKAVQAANKKGSTGGSVLTNAFLIKQAGALSVMRQTRTEAKRGFILMVDAINRGHFSSSDLAVALEIGLGVEVLVAGWDLGQVDDQQEPPSFFHLPSITCPGQVVRLLGGPLSAHPGGKSDGSGVIYGLGFENLREVIPLQMQAILPKPLFSGIKHGHVFCGGPTAQFLQMGGLEGLFMTLAAVLRRRYLKHTAFYPVLELLERLDELGSIHNWDHENDPVLDAQHLFVPDLQIMTGGAQQLSSGEWSRLANLFDYRRKHGLRTYSGVHSLSALPTYFREKLLTHYSTSELPKLSTADLKEPFVAAGPISPAVGFKAFRTAYLGGLSMP